MSTNSFGTFLDVMNGKDAKSRLTEDLKVAFEAALKVDDETVRNTLITAIRDAQLNLQHLKL